MVDDLSPRQLALAGEFVKEGHAMNDALQMAREAGDPAPTEPDIRAALEAALAEHDHKRTQQVMLTEPRWVAQARAALATAVETVEHCPLCKASMDGGPIPENIRQHYAPPYRWSRKIGISNGDSIFRWKCPDCDCQWDRYASNALSTAGDTGREAEPVGWRQAFYKLLRTASLLQQNSIGCAVNHHGLDVELNGLPGWLADTKKELDAAEAFMNASAMPAARIGREAVARIIFDKAVGPKHWDNEFYSEERAGCFSTADAILASAPAGGWQDTVAVPKAALDWLFGEQPDADGKWFGESREAKLAMEAKHPRRYWWRSKFRSMIPQGPTDTARDAGSDVTRERQQCIPIQRSRRFQMNMVIGFGSTEQKFEASEEAALADFVSKSYREQRLSYFTDEFCKEVDAWLKNRAEALRKESDGYKTATDFPARYSYHWSHVVSDASYIIAVVKFHHINRRHGLSPDGWGLMATERLFKISSLDLYEPESAVPATEHPSQHRQEGQP